MQNNTQPIETYDDEIDIKELLKVFWANKKIILTITTLFVVISLTYALSVPNQYRATRVLSPANIDNSHMLEALRGLGGLASFTNMGLSEGGGSESQIAQEIMQSWSFIEQFVRERDLAVEVIAAEGWDRDSNQLEINDDVYNLASGTWTRKSSPVKGSEPNGWELYKAFKERLTISQNQSTGFISVSIEHYSPFIAKQWVDQLVTAINHHMQMRKLQQINRNIQFLEAQIQKTSIADMKGVFYTIIEKQIKDKMLAEASPEYVFSTVSPAMIPAEKSQPKRSLILVIGTLLGVFLAILLVSIRHYALNNSAK